MANPITSSAPAENTSCMQKLYDFHNDGVKALGSSDSWHVRMLTAHPGDFTILKIIKLVATLLIAPINWMLSCCNRNPAIEESKEGSASKLPLSKSVTPKVIHLPIDTAKVEEAKKLALALNPEELNIFLAALKV